jgi:multisubunit Na+/H+ antiporter MnhC subunit
MKPAPPSPERETEAASPWTLYYVLTVIVIGVLAVLGKVLGLF